MSQLLRLGGFEDWAVALEALRSEIAIDQSATLASIISMYGGMGSLNDLILYKDGQPLARENAEFDVLRSRLFTLCRG